MREKKQPWRANSRTIEQFPRCKAYLKAMHLKINDPSQTDYWLAVSISGAFSDSYLKKQGVNFDTMSGATLLTAFESILSNRAKPKAQKDVKRGKPAVTVDEITAAVSQAEIIAAMTPKGGWKAKTLADWGVPWPPPKGWRQKLAENFEAGGKDPRGA